MKAWEIDRQIRSSAVPMDRRLHPSQWATHVSTVTGASDQYTRFWRNRVPGSGAPDSLYVGMVQSMANKGYDVTEAEALLPLGLELAEQKDLAALRPLTAELMEKTHSAPKDPHSSYWQFRHPTAWEEIVAQMSPEITRKPQLGALSDLDERIYQGWLGQLAGGSFGTAIEGYSGEQISRVYGKIEAYIAQPETTNDDVVYELVLLDVFARRGRSLTSRELALEWVRQIPLRLLGRVDRAAEYQKWDLPTRIGHFSQSLFGLDRGADARHGVWYAGAGLAFRSRTSGLSGCDSVPFG